MSAKHRQRALAVDAKAAFTEPEVKLLQHALATIAYRTQKALRGASLTFAAFEAGQDVRTPQELVRHMASVIGYACTFFAGGTYRPEPLDSFAAEIDRFHENLQRLSAHLASGKPPVGDFADLTAARLLQGPPADVLTHAGQLALLRRLAGEPVPPENFVHAAVDPDQLGPAQAEPVSPDAVWPEAPTRAPGASVLSGRRRSRSA